MYNIFVLFYEEGVIGQCMYAFADVQPEEMQLGSNIGCILWVG